MMRGSQHLWGGQSVQKIGAIVGVAAIARAAFVAGRKSSTSRPFGDAAFERACVESVALEYREHGKPGIARIAGLSTRRSTDPLSARTLKPTWRRWRPRAWIFPHTLSAASIARGGEGGPP